MPTISAGLALNRPAQKLAVLTVAWILNTDASVVMGKNYVWLDGSAWADAQKWKDTGFGMA